jgi:hypothetical protein
MTWRKSVWFKHAVEDQDVAQRPAKIWSCDLRSGLRRPQFCPPSLVQPNDDGDFKGQST